jgi:hypothetical protein
MRSLRNRRVQLADNDFHGAARLVKRHVAFEYALTSRFPYLGGALRRRELGSLSLRGWVLVEPRLDRVPPTVWNRTGDAPLGARLPNFWKTES